MLTYTFSGACVCAQSSVNSGGSNSAGTGGTLSISIGQTVNHYISSSDIAISAGVQQTYKNRQTGILSENTDMLKVYPNPCSKSINIFFNGSRYSYVDYQIFDISGRLQQQGMISKTEIDISGLKSGLYLLNLAAAGNRIQTIKIIKTNQ